MKKKFCLVALLLVMATLLSVPAFADEEEDKEQFSFYMALGDSDINAVSYKFDTTRVVDFYTNADVYPEWLDEEPYQYVVKDEKGNELKPDADGIYLLEKGEYALTWSNIEEIKERLKTWEFYDDFIFYFPEEEEMTVHIKVDGEKTKITFWACPSLTLYQKETSNYVFNPAGLYVIQITGLLDFADYYNLPEYLLDGSKYTFEVKDYRGNVLSQEELKTPMKEGTYFITWNNMDEIQELIEQTNAAIFNKYTVVFPEEPLTIKFYLSFQDPHDKPTEYFGFYESFGLEEGNALPTVKDLFYFSDIEEKEDYPDWISAIELEYFDEDGNQVFSEDYPNGMPAKNYVAKWVNYFEFLEMDKANGWGVQKNYNFFVDYEAGEVPKCICEFYPKFDTDGYYEAGSIFSQGSLTIVFAGTTLICLMVIVILAIQLKKYKK